MATLAGRVGVVAKGTWDSSVAYDTLDMVTYNNSTYIAKLTTAAGTLPTNTTYWQLALDADPLQPKTMSSPVTIGGESKTTVETAVGALEDVKADKTAISSVETTSTAVAAHAVGSYFINASGQFVKTTSAIAIGDTIIVKPTVGYNCEATSIAAVLDGLNTLLKYDDISSSFTSASNFTLLAAKKINGIVYLNFIVFEITIGANDAYIKDNLMSDNLPNYVCSVTVSPGNNIVPVALAYIDNNGRFVIRTGGTALNNAAYIVTAIYCI